MLSFHWRRWLGSATALLACIALTSPQLRAQDEEWVPGKYMGQAVLEMFQASDVLQRDLDYGFAEGACMVGILLDPQSQYTITRRFEKGVAYAIVAGGDEDASDIDVEILNSKGTVVVKDDAEDRLGVVEWTPSSTGDYQIRVKLFEARIESFVAFTVLRKGGQKVSLDLTTQTWKKFHQDCLDKWEAAKRQNLSVAYISGNGQAGLWGCVLPQNESLTMTNVTPGGGQSVMMGRSHDDNIDVDIFVKRGDMIIGEDVRDDSFPQYVGDFKDNVAYDITLKNVDADEETAFVLGGVLKVFTPEE